MSKKGKRKNRRSNIAPTPKKRKFSKKLMLSALGFAIGVLIVVAGFFFIVESVPTEFTLKLSQVGNLDVVYFDQQSEKISPLCGCKEIGEWENWRGITFTSRRLDISRRGGLPVTAYLVFPAFPGPTRFYPGEFKMRIDYYLIRIRENETFNAQSLISGSIPRNYEVLKREQSEEGFVQVISDQDLKLALLGNTPLGAWVPVERSNVSIKYEFKRDIDSPTVRTITEKYLASTKLELERSLTEDLAYDQTETAMPLGDFLGPDIVFWSEDRDSTILASTKFISGSESIIGDRLIKAVVANPPFAVRLVAIPFGRDALIQSEAEAPKLKEGQYSIVASQGRFDNGEVTLRIYTPSNQEEEFQTIYDHMKQLGSTVSSFKTYGSSTIAGGKMEFKYPPIPPNSGFNIFGTINRLKIESGLGNLLLGARSFNIEAPADIELTNVQDLDVKSGVIEVPIEIGADSAANRIQLRGKSEIYVNKESITKRLDNNKTIIDYLVLIATLIGGLISIASMMVAWRDYRSGQRYL